MIKKFYVKNFGSIKDEVIVDMTANGLNDETSYTNYFNFHGEKILKVAAFYGMNASGKTAIMRALSALSQLVIEIPALNQDGILVKNVFPYDPFMFSKETQNAPIELGLIFSLDNNQDSIVYKYKVAFNHKEILNEKLEKETSQKFSNLYERTFIDGKTFIKLGTEENKNPLLRSLMSAVPNNKTLLSLFSTFQLADFSDIYNFFKNRFITITPEVSRFLDITPVNLIQDEELKKFTVKLLQAADFNISDISLAKRPLSMKFQTPLGITQPEKSVLLLKHGNGPYGGQLEFVQESIGTKKMIVLAQFLYTVFSKSSVMIVDELESSLHPELTKFIINCFLDETINKYNSQLIFTSHETSLLSLELFRREQINFVYKNPETCSTYIKSLSDFSVRKTDNIEKGYLAGRYNTSPEIDETKLEKGK
ncbi:MAG: ATP-binding protein [Erysipelotrichaceae bacterium]|jgi:AAA15 family ATPase/GTPase|nr:ATP-binding protein [Erysipelotrichaceae bacterium]